MEKEVKRVFTPKLIISLRSARKQSSYLVRTKVCSTKRTEGSYKCDRKRCEVCINVNKQYVEQTIDQFRSRWNNWKSDCSKHDQGAACMQQHLFKNF